MGNFVSEIWDSLTAYKDPVRNHEKNLNMNGKKDRSLLLVMENYQISMSTKF